jgi:hypothetical protein
MSGGDSLETRKNNQDTYFAGHEFSVNVNNLTLGRPAVGELFRRIYFIINQYVSEPTLLHH